MDWAFIQTIASIIGGLLLLIYFGWQTIEKVAGNIGWVKRRREEKEKEKREKIKQNAIEIGKELYNQELLPKLIALQEENQKQNERLDKLLDSSNDILRKDITKIYYKYLPYKKILYYDKEVVCKLHEDYKKQNGNSFIDAIWPEIMSWTVVYDKSDLEKKDS